MWISQKPFWFDVKIPQSSRQTNLSRADAGSRNVLNATIGLTQDL
jgi:hypothetical protein